MSEALKALLEALRLQQQEAGSLTVADEIEKLIETDGGAGAYDAGYADGQDSMAP